MKIGAIYFIAIVVSTTATALYPAPRSYNELVDAYFHDTFEANPTWAGWAGLVIILNAGYMLWLYQRMFFGEINNEKNKLLPDLSGREWAYMLPLVIMSFWIGIYPGPFLRYIEKPVNAIVKQIRPNYPIPAEPVTPIQAQK